MRVILASFRSVCFFLDVCHGVMSLLEVIIEEKSEFFICDAANERNSFRKNIKQGRLREGASQ